MFRLKALVVAGVAGVIFSLTTAATAHESCVNHGDDTSCTRDNGVPHYWLDGCDREPEGNRVRTNFKFSGFETLYHGTWDEEPWGGCANDMVYHEIHPIAWHRTCEENVSCGDVRNH
jgi:hypothetical protein